MSYSLIEQKIRELAGAVMMVSDEPVEISLGSKDFFNMMGHLSRNYGGLMVVGGGTGDPSVLQIAGVTVRCKK